ncbi:eso1 [Symbiodinium natans]|uniref:Eso1 protein n=1 Tax=Symbiodinium natans TaxID=878477 RepID=A0A812SPM0_9DINO|nr:eso1 [Symbiodinium natans]
MPRPRAIAHLDLDCFYVQVEQRRLNLGQPPWTARDSPPAAVQQWDGLIAVNYAARAHGVKRGMRAAEASHLCPGIVLVHVETISEGAEEMMGNAADRAAPDRRTQKACLRRYRQASDEVLAVVQRSAARCEMASIDEAYIDLTDEATQLLGGSTDLSSIAATSACPSGTSLDLAADSHLLAAAHLVQQLRDEIFKETGFTVSAGIAETKLVAKLGSACHKPNRQTIVPNSGVLSFMASVQIKDLRGLGGKLGQKLLGALRLEPEAPSAELQKALTGGLSGWFHFRSFNVFLVNSHSGMLRHVAACCSRRLVRTSDPPGRLPLSIAYVEAETATKSELER